MNTRLFGGILTVVLALAGAEAGATEEIVFREGKMEFDQAGPIQATPGDTLRLVVIDDDPRRRWHLQLEYAEPLADRTRIDAAILSGVLARGAARGALPAAAPSVADQAKALKGDAEGLAGSVAQFLGAKTATPAALSLLEGMANALDKARDQLAAKRSGAQPADQTLIDEALADAAKASGLYAEVQRWCANAFTLDERRLGRRELPFTVHPGNRRLTIRACYQQLEIGADKASVVVKEPTCSRGYYDLAILEPASGPRVIAGALIPVYAKSPREFFLDPTRGDALTMSKKSAPTGDVEPTLFVTARNQVKRSPWGWGPEVGFGVGERLGQLYSLGMGVDCWGVGIGLGVALDTKGSREAIPGATTGTALDRTRESSLVSWYVRIGLSSELWDAVSRGSGGAGSINVAQQPPEPALSTGATAPEK